MPFLEDHPISSISLISLPKRNYFIRLNCYQIGGGPYFHRSLRIAHGKWEEASAFARPPQKLSGNRTSDNAAWCGIVAEIQGWLCAEWRC